MLGDWLRDRGIGEGRVNQIGRDNRLEEVRESQQSN
jgi:hypothetical protein